MSNLKLKKAPTYDRQKSSKQPLSRTVTVYLDDEALLTIKEAEQALGAAELRRDAEKSSLARLEAAGATEDAILVATARYSMTYQALEEAQAALQAVMDDLMENHAASFRLVSIGRKRYDRLLLGHPPTEEQNVEHQAELQSDAAFNADTFPPALLQVVCVEPRLELWEWKAIFDWDLLTNEELTIAGDLTPPLGDEHRAEIVERLREAQPEWNMSELVELTQAAIEVCTHRRVVNLGKAYG